MRREKNTCSSTKKKRDLFFPKARIVIIVLEICLVAALLILWFGTESLRESKNLWILFLYAFPSNFLAGVVPYDPAIIYFGKFYSPLYVTLIGVASVLVVEGVNYSVLNFISDTKILLKIERNKIINKLIMLFKKAPFAALCIAGFLPIPFYPFRFLVALSRYPFTKYILAVLLAKTPRVFILALLGYVINIPDYLIFCFFVVLIVMMYISFVINHLKERRKKYQ